MIKAMKHMYQLLLTEPHAPTLCERLERIAREAIKELESQEPLAKLQEPTVTVRYDLSAADAEGAIRDKLIELGWTPPMEQNT
jgi:hypothetical protein